MIRRLLFILFLYVLLVWILSYLYAPANFMQPAMFWSAVGLAVLLTGVIGERLFAWWRGYRAKRAARPPAAQPPAKAPVQSEEEAVLASLITEADQRLAKAPQQTGARRLRVAELPIYLVVGPSAAGKTSVMQDCGIEPVLLAGQALSSAGGVAPTRVANIWFARESIFVELAGRIFEGDPTRLRQLIQVLRGQTPAVSGWRSWLSTPEPAAQVRATLLFCDSAAFLGEAVASKLDPSAQLIRERLAVLAQAVEADLPVYAIFTKADGVRGFPDFFARTTEPEIDQVFGVLTDTSEGDAEARVWAEAETKRLNRHFQTLMLRLDDRRRLALALEPDARRKPAIYEFPREFKKIRTAVVQFLVDVFQPNPLTVGPRLIGLFFTGVVTTEAGSAGDPATSFLVTGVSDATQIFNRDNTVFLKRPLRTGSSVIDRRAFAGDLFENVLIRNRPLVARRAMSVSDFGMRPQIAVSVAAALALLCTILWTVSWAENRALAGRVERAVTDLRAVPSDVSLASLNALEQLRQELVLLDSPGSLSRHWGLYQGGKLRQLASAAYFERLKRASLGRIDATLGSQLQAGADFPANLDLLYDRLKTYRTISGNCAVDGPLVLKFSRATAWQTHPELATDQQVLLSRQLEYYSSKLRPVPVKLDESAEAEEKARAYLRRAGGLEQQFRGLLSAVEEKTGKLVVADSIDFQGLMDGPAEISAAFSPKGTRLFEELVAKGNTEAGKDRCVMGDSTAAAQGSSNEELRARYYREYAAKWREFLASARIRPFLTLDETARRLGGLTDAARSPLLGIVKFVAVNSVVSNKTENTFLDAAKQKMGLKDLEKKANTANAAMNSAPGGPPPLTKADLETKLLQPALFIVPPPFDHTVNDNDGAYVKGLRDLGAAAAGLARAAGPEKPPKVQEAETAVLKAREAHSALVDKFSDVGRAGVNEPLTELLAQPIKLAEAVIGRNRDTSGGPQKDADIKRLCGKLKPILSSYPFSRDVEREATLKDLKDAFAPKTGWISQYAEQSEILARQGGEWQEKPGLAGLRVSPELLKFLNTAQRLTDAFFAGPEPHFEYTLRPCTSSPECDARLPIKMTLDGKEMLPNSVMRVQFHRPAAAGERMGAEGFRVFSAGSNGFGSFDKLWGVFRLFQNADKRGLGSGRVVWSEIRGLGNARPQPLDPPVKVDILGITSRTDVLNPAFFEGLQPSACPNKAVVPN